MTCSKANLHAADEKIGGAASVLLDAIATLPGKDSLATNPAAKTLVTDAHKHCKYGGGPMGRVRLSPSAVWQALTMTLYAR